MMVKGSWIKPGAVVIDCGINAIPGMLQFNYNQDPLLAFYQNQFASC